MMLACGAVAGTGGSWLMLAIIGAPLLGLVLGAGLRRSPTSPVPPPSGTAPASELPAFPLATQPSLEAGTSERDAREDDLVGV